MGGTVVRPYVRAVDAEDGFADPVGTCRALERAEALARLRAYRAAGAELVMAGLSAVASEAFVGSPLLGRLVEAAGGELVVFSPDGRRLLPVYALPAGVRLVLLTAAVVDRATVAIDEKLQHLLDLAGVMPE